MTHAWLSFVERLIAAPRLSAVEAFDERAVVVRVEVPGQGRDGLVSTLRCYRLQPCRSWTLAWAVPGFAATIVNSSAVAYVAARGSEHEIRRREASGVDLSWHRLQGRIGAMAFDWENGALACTVEDLSVVRGPEALVTAGAAWFDDQRARIGAVRRREGSWSLLLLGSSGPPSHRPLPPETTLTGELALLRGGKIVLGTTRLQQDGRRRFGLIIFDRDLEPCHVVAPDKIDLTGPVASPDGARLASLGTSVPSGQEPISQASYLLSEDGELSVVRTSGGLWYKPVGWVGATSLCCLAEDGPRRRLIVHDFSGRGQRHLDLAGSVASAATGTTRVAVVVSAPDNAPALRIADPDGDVQAELERTEGLEATGCIERMQLPDPDVATPLAAWLCRPRGEPLGLVVMFHGGPLKSWTDWAWRWSPWPFVAAGFVVALVEPPMSLGYGEPVIAAGWRRWRTGIAAVAAREVRLIRSQIGLERAPFALMGGSFGGYLALLAAAELDARLVVAHGTPADLGHVAATSDVGWQWIREYGDPDTERQLYDAQSLPTTARPGMRVLLSHGLSDELVPATESLRIHRSLVRQGVRSELVMFPDEGHSVLRPKNLRAWFEWVIAACVEELSA